MDRQPWLPRRFTRPLHVCLLPLVLLLTAADDTPSLDDLVKDLEHEDVKVRREAAYHIRLLGPEAEPALPAIIKALQTDRQVWFHAVQTLARLGPVARPAIPVLMNEIAAGGQTGYRTSYALSRIGPATIAPLVEALKKNEDSVEVRVNVARALGWLGPAARETVPILAKLLRPDDRFDERSRDQAAWALGRIGAPAVPDLVVALSDTSKETRVSALKALSMIGPEAAVAHEVVHPLTRDDAPKVRELAVTVLRLSRYPQQKLLPIAIERLSDTDTNVRAAARTALARLDPTIVVAPLEVVVKSESDRAIQSAAEVLSRLGEPANATTPSLVDALERKESPETRSALVRALGRLGLPSFDPLVTRIEQSQLDESRINAFMLALAAIGDTAVPDLISALDRQSPSVRLTAATALAEIGPPAASTSASALTGLLHDDDDRVRAASARALGALGEASPLTNDSLIARTLDESPSVRAAAVTALRHTGLSISTFCRVLVAVLGDEEAGVREEAAKGLAGLGAAAGNAEAALLEALRDESSHVRTLAATALGQIEIQSIESALVLLVTALKSSKGAAPRCAVLETIGGLGPRAATTVPAVVERAVSVEATETERVLAIRVLGTIGLAAAEAFPALKKTCLEGPDKVRAASATALPNIEKSPKNVVPILVKAVDDTALLVRLRAMKALESLGPAAQAAEAKLFERLFEDWDDRRPASEALEKIGPQSLPHLTKALAHEHRFMKRFAAKHLARLGADARDVLPALREALDKKESEPVRDEIDKAIKTIEAAKPKQRINL